MSREETVWAEIVSILRNDPALSYIQQVYEGWRDNAVESLFPCIYLEPEATTEEPYSVPNRHKLTFTLRIIAESSIIDADKQIIGDTAIKGVIDIANDIKSVLWKTPNLNLKCQRFNFSNTTYSFKNFPLRQVDILMNIELITTGAPR
jgi:hypothetical protein